MITEQKGTWGKAREVAGTLNASGGHAQVNSISCASAGNCVAAGQYFKYVAPVASTQAFEATEKGGAWSAAQEVPGTAKLNVEGLALVVQDGFHPTPTSDYAHLVLPAAIWGEKEGTYTNSERRVSKVNPAVAPPCEARPDFDIFLDIAQRLGVSDCGKSIKDELYPCWTTTHDAFLEWQRVSSGRMCDYSNFTWQQIEDANGLQWGGTSLYRDGIFPTEDGRARRSFEQRQKRTLDGKQQAVQQPPDEIAQRGTMPETAESHDDHQIEVGPHGALTIATKRNVEVGP